SAGLSDRIRQLRAAIEASFAPAEPHGDVKALSPQLDIPISGNLFTREGEEWRIVFNGRTLRLRDAKGVHYIATLLRRRGEDVHVADIANAAPGPADGGTSVADRETDVTMGLGDAGPVLDPQARREYRRRLEDLREELEQATSWADSGRASKARAEIEF